jgi:hypothetical protein
MSVYYFKATVVEIGVLSEETSSLPLINDCIIVLRDLPP